MTHYLWNKENGFFIGEFVGTKDEALELGYVEVDDEDYNKLLSHEVEWKMVY